jgi:hypothetical protein
MSINITQLEKFSTKRTQDRNKLTLLYSSNWSDDFSATIPVGDVVLIARAVFRRDGSDCDQWDYQYEVVRIQNPDSLLSWVGVADFYAA